MRKRSSFFVVLRLMLVRLRVGVSVGVRVSVRENWLGLEIIYGWF